MKKSLKSTMVSQKKPSAAASGANTGAALHQTQSTQNFTQSAIHSGAKASGVTGLLSDSSFNNVTIRSNDKYNSTLHPTKKSLGMKHRELKNIAAQDLPNASTAHPLSAKNGKEGKKGIFQGAANASSAANLNANASNYHSQRVGQQPGASKHYVNSGSMAELPSQPQTNLNSNSVYQRSAH